MSLVKGSKREINVEEATADIVPSFPDGYARFEGDVFTAKSSDELKDPSVLDEYYVTCGSIKPSDTFNTNQIGVALWHDVTLGKVYRLTELDANGSPVWTEVDGPRYVIALENDEENGIEPGQFLGEITNRLRDAEREINAEVEKRLTTLREEATSKSTTPANLLEEMDQE